jgi:hypothetical protein
MADIVEIMDFAADDVAIDFWVGEDHFFAVPDIPLGLMQKIVKIRDVQKTVTETGNIDGIIDIFDELLDEESAALFRVCIEQKKTIGIRRLMKILLWLMEQYGLHPTQPSSPSSDGLSDGVTGTSSTDGVSLEVSIRPDPLLDVVISSP